MAYKTTIAGLRHKRARLAGEIEAAEHALTKQREAMAALDATLRLFHPAADPEHIATVRPYNRCLNFRHGEMSRYCREALRDAGCPLNTRQVTEYVMRAKGLARDDTALWPRVRHQVNKALTRMTRRGRVRQLASEPEAWWELVGHHVS
jgi:hypothetical protein